MLTIAVIVGSLRKESINKKWMLALDKLAHPNLTFNIIEIKDVPLFNQDHENDMPAAAAHLKSEVTKADGVLFATPEYNRSIPGVLKNIIDWGTRPSGKNCWVGKPMSVIGVSPGNVGTAAAQAYLRSILVTIGGVVMGQPEVYLVNKPDLIDADFNITNTDTKKFLLSYLDSFAKWVESHK